MEVVIRPFRPDDWDGLFLLDRSCFEPPFRLEVPRLRALVQDPTSAVVVIEARDGDETAIVGSLIVKHDAPGGRLILIGIMVDAGFRRVGLGRRLAGWAERIGRASALSELLAPLEAENEDGGAFLAAVGFAREPGVPPFFDDPAGGNLWRRTLLAEAAEPPAPAHEPLAEAEPPAPAHEPVAAAEPPAPAGEPASAEEPVSPAAEPEPAAPEPAAASTPPERLRVPAPGPAAVEAPATRIEPAEPETVPKKSPVRPPRKAGKGRPAGAGHKRRRF